MRRLLAGPEVDLISDSFSSTWGDSEKDLIDGGRGSDEAHAGQEDAIARVEKQVTTRPLVM